jgi:hypothetical protein
MAAITASNKEMTAKTALTRMSFCDCRSTLNGYIACTELFIRMWNFSYAYLLNIWFNQGSL